MNEPIHVTDESFEKVVFQSLTPVIVDFWAPWCGPCKMLSPLLDQLANAFDGKLIIAKVNVDDYPELAGQLGVQNLPTLIFVRDGEVVDRHVGSMSAAALRAQTEAFLE